MEEHPHHSEESKILYEILDYLVAHPKSCDTLDGIVQWWLLEQRIKAQSEKVKKILDELVSKGWILEKKGKDMLRRYSVNKKKFAEILDFLKK